MFKKIGNKIREKSRIIAKRSLGKSRSFWRLFLTFYLILFLLGLPLNLIDMTASLKEAKGKLQSKIEAKEDAMYWTFGEYLMNRQSYSFALKDGWGPKDIQGYQFLNPSYLHWRLSEKSSWWCLYDIKESRMVYDNSTQGYYAQVLFSNRHEEAEDAYSVNCYYWLQNGRIDIPPVPKEAKQYTGQIVLMMDKDRLSTIHTDWVDDWVIWTDKDDIIPDAYRYTADYTDKMEDATELQFFDEQGNTLLITDQNSCYIYSNTWYREAAMEDFLKWKENYSNPNTSLIDHVETKDGYFHKKYSNRLVLEDEFGNPEYLLYSSFAFPEEENAIIKIWAYGILAILLSPVLVSLLFAFLIFRRSKENHAVYQYRTTLNNAMAHDLKTPLMAISGYAENISMETNPDKRDYYVEEIQRQTDYMKSMVDGIRQLAESGDSDGGMRELIQLQNLSQEVIEELQPVLSSRNLTIRQSGNCSIKANVESMRTVLRNLIENACKYATEGSEIAIDMSKRKLTIGNDMEQEIQTTPEKLLEPFTKGDTSRNGRKGTGLGLAVVKSICDMHGFRISLETKDRRFCACIKF